MRKVAEALLEEETEEVLMEIEEATSPDNDADGSDDDKAKGGEEGDARDPDAAQRDKAHAFKMLVSPFSMTLLRFLIDPR